MQNHPASSNTSTSAIPAGNRRHRWRRLIFLSVAFLAVCAYIAKRREERAAEREKALRLLPAVQAKFICEADPIRGGGYYKYKDREETRWLRPGVSGINMREIPNPKIPHLGLSVLTTGEVLPIVHSLGETWLFPYQLIVRIGTQALESDRIIVRPEESASGLKMSGVYESLSLAGGDDNGILEAIAQSRDSVFLARLAGERGHRDFIITSSKREEIQSVLELGRLLRIVDAKECPRNNEPAF